MGRASRTDWLWGAGAVGEALTGVFVSRQCPGIAIHAAMDWALQQASAKRVVVLARSVL